MSKRITRRDFLQATAAAAGAGVLARCAPKATPIPAATPTTVPVGKVPINIYSWQIAENYMAHYDFLKETFEAEHPEAEVNVRYLSNQDFVAALMAATAAGEQPDLFQENPGTIVIDMIKDGLLMDLTPHIEGDSDWKKWTDMADTTPNYRYVEGKIHLLCNSLSPMFILWHKDILEDHGLDLPETIDDLKAMVPVLAESGIYTLSAGFRDIWLYANTFMPIEMYVDHDNSWWYKVEHGEESPNNEKVRKVLEVWEDICKAGVFYPGQTTISYSPGSDEVWTERKAAGQWVVGIWAMDRIPEEDNKPEACKIDISTWPKIEKSDPLLWIGGLELMHGVKAEPDNPELVLAFAKHMNSPEAQENIVENRFIPVWSEAIPKESLGNCFFDKVLKVQLEAPYWNQWMMYTPSLEGAIATGMAELSLGTTTVDAVLENAEKAWEEFWGY